MEGRAKLDEVDHGVGFLFESIPCYRSFLCLVPLLPSQHDKSYSALLFFFAMTCCTTTDPQG